MSRGRKLLGILCLLLSCSKVIGQEYAQKYDFPTSSTQSIYTTVYTVQDGLAQNSVSDILKDENGFMWMISKDGISRFDGYDFKNYKASSKDLQRNVSNQFLSLKRDQTGCMWLLNDIGQVLRFDPENETFTLHPSADENKGDNYFTTSRLIQLSPTEFWLIGSGDNGTICVTIDSLSNVSMHHFREKQDEWGSTIRMVTKDQNNRRWILTDKGLISLTEADTTSTIFHFNVPDSSAVYGMIETPNEWVVAGSYGRLFKFEKSKRRFTTIQLPTHENILSIYKLDANRCFVLSSDNQLFVIQLMDEHIIYQKSIHSTIENSWQDEQHNVWLQLKKKSLLYCYHSKENTLREVLKAPSNWLSTFQDTMGVQWLASPNAGVEKRVSFSESFQLTLCDPAQKGTIANDVTALLEDNRKRLWVATKDGSLRLYDMSNQFIGFVDVHGNVCNSDVSFPIVTALYQDRSGFIWVATEHALYMLSQQSDVKFSVTNCQPSSKEYAPLSYSISDILEDSKGHLWLATRNGGLHLLQKEGRQFRFIHKENLFKNSYPSTVEQSHTLMEDTQGNIWLGSSEGLTIFSSDFESPEQVRFLFYNTENTNLTNSCIYDVYQDASGTIWLASYGGGLFKLKDKFMLFQTPEFISFNKKNSSFPSDLLLDIVDDQSNLWVLTEESIVKFSEKNRTSESFGQFRGFRTDYFSGRKLVNRYSGQMTAASNDGFYSFRPSEIVTTDYSPSIVFTRFFLFNKEQSINDEDSPIHQSINSVQSIVLDPHQSVFSIGYAALDYRFPEHIQYAYKLEPFETEWNYVGTQRLATYTNLPKGEYRFMVKSTNCEGIWYDNVRELNLVVLPTFWETGWAYVLYFIILTLLLGTTAAIYRLRTKIKVDQEISDSKLQFFTDISHELRTPLTLINAPLENVLENGSISQEDRKQLEVVHMNANRMLRMMNQILDFRKIQSNKMRLKVEKTNLGQFISSCSANFLRLAENRHIQFSIADHTNGATFWIDKDKLDTVMFNLLSNAFKFTKEGKKVSVEMRIEDGNGIVVVSDEGCGMPKDKLSVIFDRYTTLQDYSLTKQSGTGIGLSLVKEIIDLHKAKIRVQSEENVGSTFTLTFLPGVTHYDNSTEIIMNDDSDDITETFPENNRSLSDTKSQTLLLVEDNDQMREFLKNVLQKQFVILEAANGQIGYETAVRELPNFILTDIMMPVMDGIEMTKHIRTDEKTSHIPIVLLTAKTDLQSKIECMKIGANDYITKPFSMAYLEARIQNILEERKKWQLHYRDELMNPTTHIETDQLSIAETNNVKDDEQYSVLNIKDDELMKRFIDLIDQNMDNVSFTIEEAQDILKVSRWHLLSKTKSLVGLTPTEFIRETRLTYAAKLIEEGKLSMTEIAYKIGMSDSRYFSRCFKQKYGVSPTEYKQRK